MIEGLERINIELTHTYGLTEVYGPSAACTKQEEWESLAPNEIAVRNGRQGVPYVLQGDAAVLDPERMERVPADGETMGEIMFRGNIVMKGYLKNPVATQKAFAGGWFHSGDLAVTHADGYMKIKDRAKDIIISGGENISSLEVEEALFRHPAVFAAAVVAQPHEKWGETPIAFVELRPGKSVSEDELVAYCYDRLARFKVPKTIVFGPLPRTSTGKVQKFVLRERAKSVEAIV
jgi:fatty-acyl-CoA synthase